MLKYEISGTSVRTTNESGMRRFFFCPVTILKQQKTGGGHPPPVSLPGTNSLKATH